jgi:WD40 repeat protein
VSGSRDRSEFGELIQETEHKMGIFSGPNRETGRIWRVSDGSPVQVLTGHADGVYGVQFSPDGEWLVTASEDKTAVLWKRER